MTSSIQDKSYNFHFPHNEQGIKDACLKLKETLEKTQSLAKINICLIFESKEHPNNLFSASYERDFMSKLTFNSLETSNKIAIKGVFQHLGISINSVTDNEAVSQTAKGGLIVNGYSTTSIGIRGGLDSLRALFPGMSDEELQRLFNK